MSEFCLIKISKYNVPCEQQIVSHTTTILFPSKLKMPHDVRAIFV